MNTDCNYANIPDALVEREQWVAWQPVERGGKLTKQPVNVRNGKLARTDHPEDWATLEEAIPHARRHRLGIGYVFAADDPFAGVDLDDCLDPATGALADWARFICWHLDSYTEVSPSGRGVKVIVRGAVPPGRRGWGGNGLYDRLRFFTITGQALADYPATIENRAAQLAMLHGLLFPPRPAPVPGSAAVTVPCDLTDDEVIRRAGEAANGHKFRALWAGDVSGYGSHSEADAALIGLLHFWVGDDQDRLDRLFRQSGLYREEKWGKRPDYRDRTMRKAANGAVYEPKSGGLTVLRGSTLPPMRPLLTLLEERRGA